MDLEQYNKLKQEIDSKSFEQNYKVIDKILYFASFLGNIASIVFAYFFLSSILNSSTDEFPGKSWVLPFISIISLTTFELLKRFLFKKLALSWVSNKKMTKEIIANLSLSIIIISTSFYLAISGANKFADKGKEITQNTDLIIKQQTDSLNKVYSVKIEKLERDKAQWVELINGTRSVKLRTEYNNSLSQISKDIKDTETERLNSVKELEKQIKEKSLVDVKETHSNQLAFILITTFIELLILVGVWFNASYNYRSLKEYEEVLLTNDQYHQYILHEKLLNILYNNGKVRLNEQVVSFTRFNDLVKLSGIKVIQKDTRDFLSISNNLTITNIVKGKRYIGKTFEEAKEILKNHYNF